MTRTRLEKLAHEYALKQSGRDYNDDARAGFIAGFRAAREMAFKWVYENARLHPQQFEELKRLADDPAEGDSDG